MATINTTLLAVKTPGQVVNDYRVTLETSVSKIDATSVRYTYKAYVHNDSNTTWVGCNWRVGLRRGNAVIHYIQDEASNITIFVRSKTKLMECYCDVSIPRSHKHSVKLDYDFNRNSTVTHTHTYNIEYTDRDIPRRTYNVVHWLGDFKHQEGDNTWNNCTHLKMNDNIVTSEYLTLHTIDKDNFCLNSESYNGVRGGTSVGSWTEPSTYVSSPCPLTGIFDSDDKKFEVYSLFEKYPIEYQLRGTNNPKNPTSYSTLYGVELQPPTNPKAESFHHWAMETEHKKVVIDATTWRYTHKSVYYDVKVNTKYTVTVKHSRCKQGNAKKYSVVLFAFHSNTQNDTALQRETLEFSESADQQCTLEFTDPKYSSYDVRILFYAGEAGYTENVAAEFSGVTISANTNMINNKFLSFNKNKETLRGLLNKRNTGAVKFRGYYNYRVTYDAKMGSNYMSTETRLDDEEITFPRPPERSGYTFKGWSTNPNAKEGVDNLYNPGSKYPITSNVTFYAVWQMDGYRVTTTSPSASNITTEEVYNPPKKYYSPIYVKDKNTILPL